MREWDCVWVITCTSPDDGRRVECSYFTDMHKAEEVRKTMDPRLNPQRQQISLWKDGDRWYKVERKEVFVDVPSRQEVLAKLSPAERKVLGI